MYTLYRLYSANPDVTPMYLGYSSDIESLAARLGDPEYRQGQHVQFIMKHGGVHSWVIEELKVFSTRAKAEHEKVLLLNLHPDVYTLNKNGFVIPPKRRYRKTRG